MSVISEEVTKVIEDICAGRIRGEGGASYDATAIIKGESKKMTFKRYRYMYDVCIHVWDSTMDFWHIGVKGRNFSDALREKTDEIIKIMEFINGSREEIINAIDRDTGLDGFVPTKVSGAYFDYSSDKPEFSFYVESNDEFLYHVYIKDDMSLDARYIS